MLENYLEGRGCKDTKHQQTVENREENKGKQKQKEL